jgi:Cu-Zn family superoxide dismutase
MTKRIMPVLAAGAIAATCLTAPARAQGVKDLFGGPEVTRAVAVLQPTEGNKVAGTVTFTKTDKGIRVQADVSGLTPGKHGIHVHEFGDASSANGMAAGGHFNPHKREHGSPTAANRHVGDLGNIEADSAGHASFDLVDPAMGFSGATSILGRSLVIHETADDFRQPSGDSGNRLAVGVIGISREK